MLRDAAQPFSIITRGPLIVQLARNLGLEPLAEGVETEAQRRFLVEHGCMLGQGFYFSRAVPAEQIAELHARTVRRAA